MKVFKMYLSLLVLIALTCLPYQAFSADPTIQAKYVGLSSITNATATVSWTNGNGAYRMVVVKATNTSTNPDVPTANTNTNSTITSVSGTVNFSTANAAGGANFLGSDLTETGWKVVYNGNGSTRSVNLTNLDANTDYRVAVIEYNLAGGKKDFTTTMGSNNNPRSFKTAIGFPTIGTLSATGVDANYTADRLVGTWTPAGTVDGYKVKLYYDNTDADAGNTTMDASVVVTGGAGSDDASYDYNDLDLGNTESFEFSGLLDGTDYQFKVKSYIGNIESDYSSLSNVATTVNDDAAPTFTIQYYSDANLTTEWSGPFSSGAMPLFKAGTYYLKITSNEVLSSSPTIDYISEGAANDATNATTIQISENEYMLTRVVAGGADANGMTADDYQITGTDLSANTATDQAPTNQATKRAYIDNTPPTTNDQLLNITAVQASTEIASGFYNKANYDANHSLQITVLQPSFATDASLNGGKVTFSIADILQTYPYTYTDFMNGNVTPSPYEFSLLNDADEDGENYNLPKAEVDRFLSSFNGYEGTVFDLGLKVYDKAGNMTEPIRTNNTTIDNTIPYRFDITAPTVKTTGMVYAGGSTANTLPRTGYWNSGNNQIIVRVPLDYNPLDNTIEDGTIRIQYNNLNNVTDDWQNLNSSLYTIVSQDLTQQYADVVINAAGGVDDMQLDADDFIEGQAISFRAIVTDFASNSTTFNVSNTTLTVDETMPGNGTTGALAAKGGAREVAGYYNSYNTSLEVTVPIDNNDNTLVGGKVIIGLDNDADNSFTFNNDSTAISGTLTSTYVGSTSDASLVANSTEFVEGASAIEVQAKVMDRAGNITTYTKSASTFLRDETLPIVSAATLTPNTGTRNIGQTITLGITADAANYTQQSGLITVNGVEVASFNDAGAGSYTGVYTIVSGNTDRTAGNVPVSIILQDAAGNRNASAFTNVTANTTAIDANKPVITNVTIPNSAMKVGDIVTANIFVTSETETFTLGTSNINGFTLGSISKVNDGEYTATFTVTNDGTDRAAGVDIPLSVIVTDVAGNNSDAYTTAISQNADAIDANFPKITNISIPNAAMKIGDNVTVTITVEDDGSSSSYSLKSGGTINGITLTDLTSVSNTSLTAKMLIANDGTDVAAGSDIDVNNITLIDGATNEGNDYDTDISQGADPIDANYPKITAVSIPDVDMIVGDVVTATITLQDDGSTATGFSIVGGTINGFTIGSLSSVNNTTMEATFTVTNGGTDVAAGTDISTAAIQLQDNSGNNGNIWSTSISQANDPIDANRPTITSVTSNATSSGVLKVGNTIVFTVTPTTTENGATVTGSYNGQAITFASTNSGVTFVGTYTVTEAETDRTTALQISNVAITDAAGNASLLSNYSSTDVVKTIDANTPTISSVSIPAAAMKVGDEVTVTITVGDDGGVAQNTPYVISGNVNGFTLGTTTRTNATTYTAKFTVTNGGTDRLTGDNIPISVVATDPAGNGSTAYTTAISQMGDPIDANRPQVTSLTSNATTSGWLKVGDAIVFTLDVTGSEPGATIAGTYNGQTLSWGTANAGDTYTATYTIADGQNDLTTATQLTGVTVQDAAGNDASPNSFGTSDIQKTIDANIPNITNVTIPNTTKKIGDNVQTTITVTDEGSTSDFTVTGGTIGGMSLNSSTSSTNNTTIVGTLPVTEGSDILAASNVPVTNLVVTDQAGNISSAYTNNIVQNADLFDRTRPTFQAEYYLYSLTGNALGNNPVLGIDPASGGDGRWLMKITSSEALSAEPTVSITGTNTASLDPQNVYTDSPSTFDNGNIYTFVRYVASVANDDGKREVVTIKGQDANGNYAADANVGVYPTNMFPASGIADSTLGKQGRIDATRPTISTFTYSSAANETNLSSNTINIGWSEAVQGMNTSRITLAGSTGATKGTFTNVSGLNTNFTQVINHSAEGTIGVNVPVTTSLKDGANNAYQTAPSQLNYIYDVTAPVASVNAITVTNGNSGQPVDEVNDSDPLTFTFTITELNTISAQPTVSVMESDGTTLIGTATYSSGLASKSGSTYTFAYTFTPSGALNKANCKIKVNGTDLAGNTFNQTSTSGYFTIDNTAPVITVNSVTKTSGTGSDNDFVKSTDVLTVDYSITETNTIVNKPILKVYDDLSAMTPVQLGSDAVTGSSYPDASGVSNETVTYTVGTGNYPNVDIQISATDKAGNTATPATSMNEFTIDNTLPTVNITAPVASSYTNGSQVVNYSVTETNPTANTQAKIASGTLTNFADGAAISTLNGWSTNPVNDGAQTITVSHTDKAGNVGSNTVSVNVDNTLPLFYRIDDVTESNRPVIQDLNDYITVKFTEAIYTDASQATIQASDFSITNTNFGSSGKVDGITIESVKDNTGASLQSNTGYTEIRVYIEPRLGGVPASPKGDETFKLSVANGSSIFDRADNAMANTENSGTLTLKDETPPEVTGLTAVLTTDDDAIYEADIAGNETLTIAVTFNEAMKADHSADPSFTFAGTGDSPSSTFTSAGQGSWSNSNMTFTQVFNLSDQNINTTNVTIDVTGAKDAQGTGQADYTPATELTLIDTKNPTVTSVTFSDALLTDADATNTKTITVDFSENMKTDGSANPTFTFYNGVTDVTSSLSTTLTSGTNVGGSLGWTDADTYVYQYTIGDGDLNITNVKIDVTGTKDAHNNDQQNYTEQNEFAIDMDNAIVSSSAVNKSIVADANAGQTFTVAITYPEEMISDNSANPTITFGGTGDAIATSLTSTGGVWSSGNTVYTESYTISDQGVDRRNITVSASGAKDLNGNLQQSYTSGVKFYVDTKNPTIASSVPADNASGINNSANVAITFSENIAFASTSKIITLENADFTTFESYDVTTPGSNLSISSNVLTINPTTDFPCSGTIDVVMQANAFTDAAGNTFGAVNRNELDFLIATYPTLFTISANNNNQFCAEDNAKYCQISINGSQSDARYYLKNALTDAIIPSTYVTGSGTSMSPTEWRIGAGGVNNIPAGTYQVVAEKDLGSSTFGCALVQTGTLAITSRSMPTSKAITPSATSVCADGEITIEIPTSQTGVSYQLRNTSTSVDVQAPKTGNGNTLTWTLTNLQNVDEGNYIVTGTYTANPTCATIMTGNFTLTVTDRPTATFDAPGTLCQNVAGDLTVTVSNTDPAGIVYPVVVNIDTDNNTATTEITATIANAGQNPKTISVNPQSTTTYKLISITQNNSCTVASLPADKMITVTPISAGANPSNANVCESFNTSFTTTNPNSYSIVWQVSTNNGTDWTDLTNTGIYTNTTSTTLNLTGVTLAYDEYDYRAKFTNSGCVEYTASANLNVDATSVAGTISSNHTICSTNNADLTFSVTGGTGTIQWQVNTGSGFVNVSGGDYSGGTTSTLTVANPTTKSGNAYRAVFTNGVCTAANSGSATITVDQAPTTANAGSDIDQCNTSSFTLAGNTATVGTGTWTRISGFAGITITSPNSPTSTVTGLTAGNTVTLRWTIANGVCTSSFDDVVLTNFESPTTSAAGDDQTLCNTSTFTMAANAPTVGTGAWSFVGAANGASITTASSNTTTITGLTAGNSATLRWTISNGNCTASTDDVVITNNALPTTSAAGDDQTLCNTSSFTLAGNTPTVGTGAWSIIGAANGATITTPSSATSGVTGLTAGNSVTLRWTISNGVCTPSTDDVVLTNVALPTTAAAGDDQTLCNTSSFTMAANTPTVGTGAWSIIGAANGATITSSSSPTTSITGLTAGNSVTLRWTISNGVCTASTDDVILTNVALPTTSSAGDDQTLCNTSTFTMAANAPTVGTGAWSIIGAANGASITSSSSPTTSVTGLTAGNSVTLRWTISNGICTASTDDVILTNVALPTTSAAGDDQTLCNNSTFTMAANTPTVGTGAWSIIGAANGASITSSSSPTTTVTGLTAGNSVTLRWTISNGVCTPSTDDVVLTNVALPTVAAAGDDQTLCNTSSFTLAGNSASVGTGAWSIIGAANGATITTPSSATSGVTGLTAGNSVTLRWTISNGVCTPSTDDVVLTNVALPTTAAAGDDQTLCNTSTFTMAANAPTIGTGAWSIIGAANGASITSSSSPTTTVTGLTAGNSVTLRWTISNGVCTASTDDVVLTNVALPTTSLAGNDQSLCNTSTFTMAANAPTVGTGAWSIIGATNGASITNASSPTTTITGLTSGNSVTLRWTISNGVCTASTDEVVLTNYALPTTSSISGNSTVCANASAVAYSVTNTSGSTYAWSITGGTQASGTNTNSITVNWGSGSTGLVSVVETNSNNCVGTQKDLNITIDPTSVAGSNPSTQNVCSSQSSVDFVSTGGTGSIQWQVSTDNGSNFTNISDNASYSGSTTGTLTVSSLAGKNTFQYRAVWTSGVCSSANTTAAVLNVSSAPSAGTIAFTGGGSTKTICQTTNTSIVSTGGSGTYQWQYSSNGGTNYQDLTDNSTYSGVNTNTLTITNAPYSINSYKYRVNRASGVCTIVPSTAVTLTVDPTSVAGSNPSNVSNECETTNMVTFTSTGGTGTIQWQVNEGSGWNDVTIGDYEDFTTTTLKVYFINTKNNYQYRAVWTSGVCSSSTTSAATLTISTSPIAGTTSFNGSSTICNNSNTSISVSGGNGAYQWQVSTNNGSSFNNLTNSAPYSGVTTNTLSITSATTALNSYQYRVVRSNGNCTNVNSNAVTLSVNPTSVAGSNPSTNTFCSTSNATFSSTGGTGTISWEVSTDAGSNWAAVSGVDYSGTTTSTLTIANISNKDTYQYRAGFTSGVCSISYTNAATLNVNIAPTAGTISTPSAVCQNTNGTITVSGGNGNIQWQVSTDGGSNYNNISNDAVYSNVTSATLNLTSVPLTYNNYKYRVVRSNGVCSSVNATAVTLTVNAVPNAPLGTDNSRCGTGSVALIANAQSQANVVIDWYAASTGGSALLTNNSTYSPNVSSTTTFYAESRNTQTGCVSATRTAVIATVNPLVTAIPDQPSGLTTVTQGESHDYSTNSVANATSYSWIFTGSDVTINGTGTNVSVVFGSSATSGDLKVAGVNGCGTGTYSTVLSINVLSSESFSISSTNSEPNGISSILNTASLDNTNTGTQVMGITILDNSDGGTSDGFPANVTGITLTQGTNNEATNFTNYIQAIALYDAAGTTKIADGTINSTNVVFSGLNLNVADNTSTSYQVRMTVKSSLPVGADMVNFQFRLNSTDVTSSTGSYTGKGIFDISTNSSKNEIDVVASKLRYVTNPPFSLVTNNETTSSFDVQAVDANNNIDMDYTSNVSITSTPVVQNTGTSVAATNGVATFSSLKIGDAYATGATTRWSTSETMTAASGSLTSATSSSFTVRAPEPVTPTTVVLDGNYSAVKVTVTSQSSKAIVVYRTGQTTTLANPVAFDIDAQMIDGSLFWSGNYNLDLAVSPSIDATDANPAVKNYIVYNGDATNLFQVQGVTKNKLNSFNIYAFDGDPNSPTTLNYNKTPKALTKRAFRLSSDEVDANDINGFAIGTLSPNPAFDKFVFNLDVQEDNNFDIEIYSITGKLVKVIGNNVNYKIGNHKIEVLLNNLQLSSGTYYLQVSDKESAVGVPFTIEK